MLSDSRWKDSVRENLTGILAALKPPKEADVVVVEQEVSHGQSRG